MTLGCLNDTLREQVWVAEGREATRSAGSIDSQSVKTSKKRASVVSTLAN